MHNKWTLAVAQLVLLTAVLLGLGVSSHSLASTEPREPAPNPVINIPEGLSATASFPKFSYWLDSSGQADINAARTAWAAGEFVRPKSAGSLGLVDASVWVTLSVANQHADSAEVLLEYVDHQLIHLTAYELPSDQAQPPTLLAQLSLDRPFSERAVDHHRFVVPVTIAPGETSQIMVQLDTEHGGFVFPTMRLWNQDGLRSASALEYIGMGLLLGSFLLMSVFSASVGVATKEKTFFIYSIYAFSKILAWATILGYTHQFVIRDGFHWNFMSVTGAASIFCGIWFARNFLGTRENLPKQDWLLKFMLVNSVVLAIAAVAGLKLIATLSVTLALLSYPVVIPIGLSRWRQGYNGAGAFTLAWAFLVASLFWQGLRDLGYVEHSFGNYYWPVFASFTEMIVILVAMAERFMRMRRARDIAEQKYLQELERSKVELENIVRERTAKLEEQKRIAEHEASTDALTGIANRRCFYSRVEQRLKNGDRRDQGACVLMFDIDHFKAINDNHGHGIGDAALVLFASVILELIRDSDVFGRLGGEEFALLVSGDISSAQKLAERLREKVAQAVLSSPSGPVQFTTSVGVAPVLPDDGLDGILNRADKALYLAKEWGRNRVVIAGADDLDNTLITKLGDS